LSHRELADARRSKQGDDGEKFLFLKNKNFSDYKRKEDFQLLSKRLHTREAR
jgi:hypothetical protein